MTKVDFILTVPGFWSHAAKKSKILTRILGVKLNFISETEDAAISAGMGCNHELTIVSEQEAAALYTLKHADSTRYSKIKVGHIRLSPANPSPQVSVPKC